MLINKIRNIKFITKDNSQFLFWRLLNIIVSGLLLVGMMLATTFIYKNIDIALTNATIISNIKSGVTFDTLDISGFERAKKTINNKKQLTTFTLITRNIFTYEEKTNSPSSTQTKK